MRAVLSRPAPLPPAADEAPRPDRKAAILLAAEKLFAQHGYHAVSIRQIAAEAGVPLLIDFITAGIDAVLPAAFTPSTQET